MGWSFTRGTSKEDIVQELLRQYPPVDYALCVNTLWAVAEYREQRFIACFLLESGGDGWGYKAMEEAMNPYYYDCPLRLLELAPVASEEWRRKVCEYNATYSA